MLAQVQQEKGLHEQAIRELEEAARALAQQIAELQKKRSTSPDAAGAGGARAHGGGPPGPRPPPAPPRGGRRRPPRRAPPASLPCAARAAGCSSQCRVARSRRASA